MMAENTSLLTKKKEIFEKVLTQEYEHKKYINFLRELLNNIQFVAPNMDKKPYDTFSRAIDHYVHIGNYVGDDGNKVALFAVCLNSDKNIDNARTMQRNFIKSLLENSDCAGALAAFYNSEEPQKWRLSLVRLDYEFSEGKISARLTPAKRYSYLVGKGEPCHTAKERLFPIFAFDNRNPGLDELEEAFSVEAVTKDFFEKYRSKYLDLKEALDKNPEFIAEANARGFDSEQFAKKLLGQIVFLYFIQKKGWLGVNAFPSKLTEREYKAAFYRPGQKPKELMPRVYKPDGSGKYKRSNDELLSLTPEEETILSTLVKGDKWGSGPKDFMRKIFDGCVKKDKNFFHDYLEPLFYTGLNQNRGDNAFFAPLHRRIPFLNGGLFEELDGYEWRCNNFKIPNELFSNLKDKDYDADGILDVFDRYNFTMSEDEPMEREVAIDPEMLGKIFENLLDVKDRKSKGAFYTPREIVHYMCQESLINYLSTKTQIAEDDIRKLVLYGEYFRDEDTKKTLHVDKETGQVLQGNEIYARKHHMELDKNKELEIPETIFSFKKSINRLPEIDKLLADIKVVDLAVGSGAFPLGMLNEIVKARDIITSYMLIDMNPSQRLIYHTMRSAYQLKRDTIKNCIFACDIEASATDITKLRLWLSLVIDNQIMDNEDELLGYSTKPRELPNLDCNIICGNSLIDEFYGIPLISESAVLGNLSGKQNGTLYDLALDKMLNQLIDLQSQLYDEKDHTAKNSLKEKIQEIYNSIVLKQLEGSQEAIDAYYRTILQPSKPFVLWQIYFPKVFKENGGFDVVIGNPPYVGEKGNKELFRPIAATQFGHKYYCGKMDLFYFFFHKAIDLLHSNGLCTFITTNYYLNANGAKILRKDFETRGNILKLINFNELKIFQSALGQHNIITLLEKNNQQKIVKCCITNNKGIVTTKILQNILQWNDNNTEYFTIKPNNLYDSNGNIEFHKENTILTKMENMKNFSILKKDITSGIDILQECVVERHLKNAPELKIGEGIFAVENDEIPNLKFDQHEMRLLKPYYTSEQIAKFAITEKNHKWIIYTNKPVCDTIDNYPNVKSHFDKFQSIITSDNKPYGLNRAREQSKFEGDKILSARMCKEPCFTFASGDTFVTRAYLVIKPNNNVNLKYLTGICNSHLFYYWLFYKGKRKGNQLQVDQDQLLELPIYIPTTKEQDYIVQLVDKIIFLITNGEDISELQSKLNFMFYNLYKLTEEEIQTIETFIKNQHLLN